MGAAAAMGRPADGPPGMTGPLADAPIGAVAGAAAVAALPNFVAAPLQLRRRVRPGWAVLWSVGADGTDNGGMRQGGYSARSDTVGSTLLFWCRRS